MRQRCGSLAALFVLAAAAACAADPAAAQDAIKGTDVMGDKGRTGPDGWVQSPQTRDQAPADTGNQTAANGRGALNSEPAPAKPRLSPGEDPGTPAAADAHGPGTTDAGAKAKP